MQSYTTSAAKLYFVVHYIPHHHRNLLSSVSVLPTSFDLMMFATLQAMTSNTVNHEHLEQLESKESQVTYQTPMRPITRYAYEARIFSNEISAFRTDRFKCADPCRKCIQLTDNYSRQLVMSQLRIIIICRCCDRAVSL